MTETPPPLDVTLGNIASQPAEFRPTASGMTNWCPTCGEGVSCDEDGLCCGCGATLIDVSVFNQIVRQGAREPDAVVAPEPT